MGTWLYTDQKRKTGLNDIQHIKIQYPGKNNDVTLIMYSKTTANREPGLMINDGHLVVCIEVIDW